MKYSRIIFAGESPANEGTAVFRIGSCPVIPSGGFRDWIVGEILIKSRATSSVKDCHPYPRGLPVTVTSEDFVVVYDKKGRERASFPRRNAILELLPIDEEVGG